MKIDFRKTLAWIFCTFFIVTICCSQQTPAGLFGSKSILQLSLSGNLRDMMNDRADEPKAYPIYVSYKNDDSTINQLRAEGKTRGHFRKLKENCYYPPLLIRFLKNDSLQRSIFNEQEKCKLVMPCKGDEYVVREWLVYQLYKLITPLSFEARLVKLNLNDTKSQKKNEPFYAILLEDEKKMSKRNKLISIERKIKPEQAETETLLKMAVFEYLIGNTDWSVQYLQNIKLVAADSNAVAITVPYDFDHSGMVNAPYAFPAEELKMSSVRERRYRGYCITDLKQFDQTISLFNNLKTDIYQLYTNCPFIDEKYKQSTIKYFDAFYTMINTPTKLAKEFGYPCDKNGTGNVVIKGLKVD